MASFFKSLKGEAEELIFKVEESGLFGAGERHREHALLEAASHRFGSFATPCDGNAFKFFVDGMNYMAAVAEAIAGAQESICIADWWFSPQLVSALRNMG
ncbi:hypothetical protein BDK51DRAFT_41595 [Blyttiomyces helicus]|uniref:Uncharacterized protein n=1 Tax=Blyttiomyces helicus TaxID=388810 RepID=A0A4P9WKA0_9FUNG|nr:hypothetical protein BDK51DRAFT_41595 [Blyttiomyces helicus]|eukprot:RKO92822.1 hypothetical protein BDK51DRAFT_41595 [Blyttiomyces helicus]